MSVSCTVDSSSHDMFPMKHRLEIGKSALRIPQKKLNDSLCAIRVEYALSGGQLNLWKLRCHRSLTVVTLVLAGKVSQRIAPPGGGQIRDKPRAKT